MRLGPRPGRAANAPGLAYRRVPLLSSVCGGDRSVPETLRAPLHPGGNFELTATGVTERIGFITSQQESAERQCVSTASRSTALVHITYRQSPAWTAAPPL